MTKAIEHFEAARTALQKGLLTQPGYADDLMYLDEMLGIAYLRKGELDNCVHHHQAENCIFPLSRNAEHKLTAGSSTAINFFKRHLARNPDNLEVRWLLNLAYMTLGQHPKGIAPEWLIPVPPSKDPLPRFPDVGAKLGVDRVSGAGGTILDDFDNDGFLDIVISSVDACESLRFFHNNGDGTFSDVTEKAGLGDQLGGINCVQTDYNNDGWLDIFVMRGGWEFPMRNSLLRNNGDGTFTDVTANSGLLSGEHRTHSAAWADFDNDGWLDVFVGHEESPSQLFRNRGDGTFEDVSQRAGVARTAFTKGAAWGDYDNDGFADLYVSNYGGANFLYHNDQTLSQAVVRIMAEENDISPNWKKHYEGKIATREDLYREEVISTLTYLKLRKIKKMIAENQAELERSTDSEEQLVLLQTHQLLKQMEMELTQTIGTVILK